jgi:hypothetical protein
MFSRWTVARVARVARVNQPRESRESRSLTIGTVESALPSCKGRYICGVCAGVNARPTCAHKIRLHSSHCFVVATYRDEIIVWQKVQTHTQHPQLRGERCLERSGCQDCVDCGSCISEITHRLQQKAPRCKSLHINVARSTPVKVTFERKNR